MTSKGQRFIIIANGSIDNYTWHRAQIHENDFIVCADGGARHAIAMRIIPDVVLGDFDSLSGEIKENLAGTKCRFESYPAEKDATDLEIALKWSLEKEPGEIVFFGAIGTRWDHSLANIFLLAQVGKDIPARIVNEYNEISLVRDGISLTGAPGDYVSVIPLSPQITGISTRGLKYILRDETLVFGTTRGVANEFVKNAASVEVKEGLALVIKAWDSPRE